MAGAGTGSQRPSPSVVWLMRNRRVVELLVDVHEDRVALDLARVDGQRGHLGDADRLARAQVEPGVVRGADQRVVVLHGALVQGLLLVGACVVHRPDVVVVQADQADRFLQPLDEEGFAGLQVVEVGDDDIGHDYFLPLAARRGAGWGPRTSIQPLRTRVRITGCGWCEGPRRTEPSARQYRDPCSGQVTVRPSTSPRLSRPAAWLHRLSSA